MGSPTPGEVCYAAWCVAYFPTPAARASVPWTLCSPDYQAAWEAAAQSVRARQQPTEEETHD